MSNELTRVRKLLAPTRDTHADWTTNNPVPAEGVLGVTKGRLHSLSQEFFVGDGVRTYSQLVHSLNAVGSSIPPYDADVDYTAGMLVCSSGKIYMCTAANGPGSTVAAVTNSLYWAELILTQASTSADGYMSAADKVKLNGIPADANAYTHPSYTARTGKPTGNATPGFGDAVTISQITSDATGHVTAATDRTITIPATEATSSAAGLMSAADKAALTAVPDTYVKKTGDTITGGLAAVGDMNAIKHTDSEHELRICGGRSLTDGGTLVLFGKDDSNTGGFRLHTSDANGVQQFVLSGYPSGLLQWGSNALGHQLVECVKSSSNNSYIRYKSGLQICMGTFSISSSTPEDGKEITFPIPFSAEPKIMISRRLTSASYTDVWSPVVYPRSATGFTVRIRWASTSGTYGYSSGNYSYTAIGYYSE